MPLDIFLIMPNNKKTTTTPNAQNDASTLTVQNNNTVDSVIKIENKTDNKPALISHHLGAYSKDELKQYFEIIEKNLGTNPLKLDLYSDPYEIKLSYDPKEKKWSLVNADNFATMKFDNSALLATALLEKCGQKKGYVMETNLYTPLETKEAVEKSFSSMKNTLEWKELHSSKKLTVAYDNKISQLDYAIARNDINWIKENENILNFKLKNTSQGTPLMTACINGAVDVVEFLLEKEKASINDTDRSGMTALMYAVHYNHSEIAKKLVDSGADVTKVANNKFTASSYVNLDRVDWETKNLEQLKNEIENINVEKEINEQNPNLSISTSSNHNNSNSNTKPQTKNEEIQAKLEALKSNIEMLNTNNSKTDTAKTLTDNYIKITEKFNGIKSHPDSKTVSKLQTQIINSITASHEEVSRYLHTINQKEVGTSETEMKNLNKNPKPNYSEQLIEQRRILEREAPPSMSLTDSEKKMKFQLLLKITRQLTPDSNTPEREKVIQEIEKDTLYKKHLLFPVKNEVTTVTPSNTINSVQDNSKNTLSFQERAKSFVSNLNNIIFFSKNKDQDTLSNVKTTTNSLTQQDNLTEKNLLDILKNPPSTNIALSNTNLKTESFSKDSLDKLLNEIKSPGSLSSSVQQNNDGTYIIKIAVGKETPQPCHNITVSNDKISSSITGESEEMQIYKAEVMFKCYIAQGNKASDLNISGPIERYPAMKEKIETLKQEAIALEQNMSVQIKP